MKILTTICIIFVFGVSLLATAEDLYSLQKSANPGKEFVSANPDIVSVRWLPNGGSMKKGALVISVLKQQKGTVEVLGPEINLQKRSDFVSGRKAVYDLYFSLKHAPDSFFELRFQLGKNRFARAMHPLRFWETIADSGLSHKWETGNVFLGKGELSNSENKGRIVLLINTSTGKGEAVFDKLDLVEEFKLAHQFKCEESDHVLTKESGMIRILPVNPEQISQGEIRIENEESKLLKKIAISPGVQEISCKLPTRGFYTVTADATYEDGSRIVTETTAAVVGPRIPEAVRKQSRYGICRVWGGSEWGVKLGSNIDYGGWDLNSVHPGKDGKLEWVGNAPRWDKNFITHAAMFSSLPKFLLKPQNRKIQGLCPPEDWNRLAEAVRLWAKKTTDLPEIINIFNEPNGHWTGTADELVKIHNVITDAIKAERPEAKVGGPGFYSIPPIHQWKPMVEKGILKNMDYLVMHAYVNATPPEEEFIEKIIVFQDYMKTTPYANLPIAFTEFGWTGLPGDWQKPISELEKARYCVRSMILCTVRDIKHLAYFCGRYGASYSIVKPDYTPYPAMASYSALIRELSTVKGGGLWLKIAPGVHGAFFKRDGKTISAFWTSKKELSIRLPEKPVYVRSMNGKLLESSQELALSPSPIYAELKSQEWMSIRELPVREILPGGAINVPGEILLAPPFLKRNGNRFEIPVEAPSGIYSVLIRSNGAMEAFRIRVQIPFETTFVNLNWNGKSDTAELVFRTNSKMDSAKAEFTLEGTEKLSLKKSVILKKGENNIVFRLPSPINGKRAYGTLHLRILSPISWSEKCEWDATPLTVKFTPSANAKPDWRKIAPIAMDGWLKESEKNQETASLKATFQAYATGAGFHLRLTAKDAVHNRKTSWTEMWKTDSLQVGFDADADSEWQPNKIDGKLNGHRVVEYAFAYPVTQKEPEVWCFKAYADGVKAGPPFALMPLTKVTRNESRKETVYTIFIPWNKLGYEKSIPNPKNKIGFSLLLNDANQDGKRLKLPFFGGISDSDPRKYGKITLIQ